MLIIDFHTHCFPDKLAQRAIESLSKKSSLPPFHNGTAADLDETQRSGGADGYVVLSIATNPRQTAAVNNFAASLQDEKRNIYAFGSVHPENEDYKEQLKAAKDLGLYGIKLHPEYQLFHVNDEKMFPIYEEIFRHEFPLTFHAGEDAGFTAPWHAEPYKIAEVAKRYPEAVIIAAHMGGDNMWQDAAKELAHLPNVYMDVSFSAGRMLQEDFQKACSMWRADRILFGTDSPWHDVRRSIEAVKKLPISEENMNLLFSGNALRILHRNKANNL